MPRFLEFLLYSAANLAAGTTAGTAQVNTARADPPKIVLDAVVAGTVGTTLVFKLMVSVDKHQLC